MDKPVEYLSSTVDTVTNTLDQNMGWLNNPSITNIAILGLVIYSAFFVGKLWPKGMDLFKHPLVKLILFGLIAFIATKNIALATVATIALVTIMMTNLKNTNEFLTIVPANRMTTDDNVYESIMGRCICRCENDQCQCNCLRRTNNNGEEQENISEEEMQIMAGEKQLLEEGERPVVEIEQSEEKYYPNQYQEMNTNVLRKIMNQLSEHEKEIMKNRVMGSKCTKSGYCSEIGSRGRKTPFVMWPYFNKKIPLTTLDTSFTPIDFD